ncbi:MAG: spheroidene monooxygenase [Chloroflexota bacterium]|nr:spheroidene monooxygenase [Chloroflexota bacterium]
MKDEPITSIPVELGMMAPLTTLTLFGYAAAARPWAFLQMGLAQPALQRTAGLRFWKLLGSGYGQGFSLQPNWGRYGLLAVWETPQAAEQFFAASTLIEAYRRHAAEIWTIYLLPVQAHGLWSGQNPFRPLAALPVEGPVAALTRATIRPQRLLPFWRAVPATSRALAAAPGLLASIGIGEAPLVRQATFSLWRSAADLKAFAYQNSAHKDAIRRTRTEDWYQEELFARFVPLRSTGLWDGHDPLCA